MCSVSIQSARRSSHPLPPPRFPADPMRVPTRPGPGVRSANRKSQGKDDSYLRHRASRYLSEILFALPRFALLERLLNQRAGFRDAVKLDERAEAWALRLTEQNLVERREPGAQRLEAVLLADGIDYGLNLLSKRA